MVNWIIEVDAKTPKQAAEQALKIMQDKESIATVFTVRKGHTNDITVIDLSQESDYGCHLEPNEAAKPYCVLDDEPDEDGERRYCPIVDREYVEDKKECRFWRKI